MDRHIESDLLSQLAHDGFERRLSDLQATARRRPYDAANVPGREVVPRE